jgi:hypothetical protein
MLRSASKILGYRLSARDGEVGRCVDFLIDDQSWAVRQIVVKTAAVKAGPRSAERELLLSPLSLPKAAWNFGRWLLESTREQLEAAPLPERDELDRDENADEHDVSQAEIELSPVSERPPVAIATPDEPEAPNPPPLPEPVREPTLRSLRELLGCELEAHDGTVGHISDLIVNDDSWTCPYLVVSESTRTPVRQVLVPIDWVNGVNATRHSIDISFPLARVHAEPEFHPEAPRYATGLVQGLLVSTAAPGPALEASPTMMPGPRRADELALGNAFRASRVWRLVPPAALANALTWGTRGLRAALARTLQGRER